MAPHRQWCVTFLFPFAVISSYTYYPTHSHALDAAVT